jgi:phospholipase/lecithinase/hemolysin
MTKQSERATPSRFLAALLCALVVASCGGGGGSPGTAAGTTKPSAAQTAGVGSAMPIASNPSTVAAAAPVLGADAAEVVRKLSAGSSEQAKAVDAALTAQFLFARADRIRQVIVFGDSLSDVGTYRVGPIAQVGGGKFTTNPGPVWPETIGVLLGTQVTPFRQGFAGESQVIGGTGFAMGGSRVSQQPGVGCDPSPTTGACRAELTIPVTEQIRDYLGANNQSFTRGQMVFVFAGANDVLFQLAVFAVKLQLGVPPPQAQAEMQAAVAQAAGELAGQVRLIIGKGATRVAVLTVPDLADTIFGQAPEQAAVRPLIAAMVQVFNTTLATGIAGTGAKVIDTYAEFKRVFENPARFHVSVLNVAACDAAKIAMLTGDESGTSLLCSQLTLVQQGAELSYFFADSVHPTTLGHLIVAGFVLTEMWRLRLL